MSLQEAISMNNRAVACMRGGRLAESLSILQAALSRLKEQFIAQTGSGSSRGEQDSSSVQLRPSVHPASSEKDAPRNILVQMDANKNDGADGSRRNLSISSVAVSLDASSCGAASFEDSSILPVYNRGFLVADDCPSERQQDSLVAVIMYNLALVFHIRGTLKGGHSSLLRRAHDFYEMVLQVIESSTSANDETYYAPTRQADDHAVILLPLVALYNMAQIHSQLIALDKMRECLDHLTNWLWLADQRDASSSGLHQDDYHFVLMNIMPYCSRDLSLTVAPAA